DVVALEAHSSLCSEKSQDSMNLAAAGQWNRHEASDPHGKKRAPVFFIGADGVQHVIRNVIHDIGRTARQRLRDGEGNRCGSIRSLQLVSDSAIEGAW